MRICVAGEGMIEVARGAGGAAQIGYGGDTLNTAIHLARCGRDVAYVTALGSDRESLDLRREWKSEGLDTTLIATDPVRGPGLYMIRTDSGERSFTYWREHSAARQMFDLPASAAMLAAAERADWFVYSLITLAILPKLARGRLFDVCRRVRANGGRVVFDGNYRPRLWPDVATAVAARDAALECCDIGLPTLDDERALGARDAADVARHWIARGCREVVVKLGSEGCRLGDGRIVAPPVVLSPIDTSGAGDAFNAAYIDARIDGADPTTAALAGHRLAGWIVLQSGAIPARTSIAPYPESRIGLAPQLASFRQPAGMTS
ncbi:sugar kinase [Polymorphobacter sp. PAMC 29334]|uniref:sugar kinase n=1 Tax=Polymorphobacter sp. PAMC 29334 TaxID=2862331 RepID=UPI001D0290EF|nr:sugar kinase [Polymorphobacter sp. PAMC 29334]